MFFVYLNKTGGGVLVAQRRLGAVIFKKENVIMYKGIIFFLALHDISVHFHSSSQPGAGDTLIKCNGILRTNDIYLFGT